MKGISYVSRDMYCNTNFKEVIEKLEGKFTLDKRCKSFVNIEYEDYFISVDSLLDVEVYLNNDNADMKVIKEQVNLIEELIGQVIKGFRLLLREDKKEMFSLRYFYSLGTWESSKVLVADRKYTDEEFVKMCKSMPKDWLTQEDLNIVERCEEDKREGMLEKLKKTAHYKNECEVFPLADYLIRTYGFKEMRYEANYFIP